MCNVLSEFVFVYTYYNYNTLIIPMFYDFRYSSKRKEADRSFALKFAGGGRSLGGSHPALCYLPGGLGVMTSLA